MEFEQAMAHLIDFEGGYVNDARDKGGVTKYGISKAAYPKLDIANLTLEEATEIYKRDFWDRISCDAFPSSLRLALFDGAVNCGPASSIKFLQSALQITPDGLIGPGTLHALDKAMARNADYFLATLLWCRFKRVSLLDDFSVYGQGWTLRMMKVIAVSK